MEAPEPSFAGAPLEHVRSKDWVTLGLLHLVTFLACAEGVLLPAAFRALEASIGLAPTRLAQIRLAEMWAISLTMPMWGALLRGAISPKAMLVMSTSALAVLTLLLAGADNFGTMLVVRTLIGVAVSMIAPVGQALIAACIAPGERGFFFGTYRSFGMLGEAVFGFYTSAISNVDVHLGSSVRVLGWRLAYASFALLSFLVSVGLAVCMKDPRGLAAASSRRDADGSWRKLVVEELSALRMCWSIKTFKLLLASGMFGGMILSTLSFSTMYFQYSNWSDTHAAMIVSIGNVGNAIGRILGGWLSDKLTLWSRYHGRPLTAQISVCVVMPIAFTIYTWYPVSFRVICTLKFLANLLGSWGETAVYRPVLSEIVEPQNRPSALAWSFLIDGAVANVLGAPLMAYLAEELFGYRPTRLQVSQMPEALRETNRRALGNSLRACLVTNMLLILGFTSLLHFTYRHDVRECDASGERGGALDAAGEEGEQRPLLAPGAKAKGG